MKSKLSLHSISLTDILYFIVWFAFFLPLLIGRISPLVNKAFTVLGLLGFLCMIIIQGRIITLDSRLWIFLSVLVWCLVITVIKSGSQTIKFIKDAVIPCFEGFLVFFWAMRSSSKKGIKSLYVLCIIFVTLDVFSLLLFPHGVINSALGSSVERAQWIFGSKNNASLYMITFVVLIAYYEKVTFDKWKWFPLAAFFACLSISMRGTDGFLFMGGSMTGLLALMIVVMLIECSVHVKKRWHKRLQLILLVLTVSVYFFLLLGGTSPVLQELVVNVLHKNMTYSGRTRIWQDTMQHIIASPFIGNGEKDFFSRVVLKGVATQTTYTYNAALKILLNYGIVGLSLIVALLLSVCRERSKGSMILFSGCIGILMIGLMNEVAFKFLFLFPLFMLASTEKRNFRQKAFHKKYLPYLNATEKRVS